MLENMYLDSLSLFEMAPGGVGQPVSQALLARQERAIQMQSGEIRDIELISLTIKVSSACEGNLMWHTPFPLPSGPNLTKAIEEREKRLQDFAKRIQEAAVRLAGGKQVG